MRFAAKKPIEVLLHDAGGNQIGVADMRSGPWVAPDEAQAEAMRAALPTLGEYGIRELGQDDEVEAPKQPTHRRGPAHKAGQVSSRNRQ